MSLAHSTRSSFLARTFAGFAATLLCLLSGYAFAGNPHVQINTSMGNIVVELYPEKAPVTVANFLEYVRTNFYDGTLFHRIIPGFMIQGGGFNERFEQKTTRAPIQNEATNGLHNTMGTIAMARTGNPHSATAQFFINHVDNPMLNQQEGRWGYAVFGRVVKGMDVVEKIARVQTTTYGFYQDVPATPVVIQSIRTLSEAK